MANTQYRLKTGHVTKANIQADTNALLSNFPTQSDQPTELAWDIARYAQVSDYVEREMTLAQTYQASGLPNFVIVFSGLTPAMFDYLIDTFLSGVESKACTIQVPDKRQPSASQLVVYQGYIHRPAPGEYIPKPRGTTPIAIEVPFNFTGGVLQA